jgi:hypothetical protein
MFLNIFRRRISENCGTLCVIKNSILEVNLVYPIDYGELDNIVTKKYKLSLEKGYSIRDYLPEIF